MISLQRKFRLSITFPVTLIVASIAAVSSPALAGVSGETCPAGWAAEYNANGYQLCRKGYPLGDAFVNVVDLKVGRLVVRSDPTPTGRYTSSAEFTKRTADEWWDWTLNNTVSPTGGQLQMVVNASFLTRTTTSFTPISFPQKINGDVNTSGTNPDTYTKRELGLYQGNTKARIANIAYQGNDYNTVVTSLSNVNSAVVGYDPLGGPTTDSARKTYVGARDTDGDGEADRLYVLVTTADISKAEATSILRDSFLNSAIVQMDGGGSTQMRNRSSGFSFGSRGCLVPTQGCRAVPDVLAIYAGP